MSFQDIFSEKDCLHFRICMKIAIVEFFEKIIDEETEECIFKCRRHGWIEGNVGYAYYPKCPECCECLIQRTKELVLYSKNDFFKDKYDRPGVYQKLVPKEELEDFWYTMEDIYPIPEEFI